MKCSNCKQEKLKGWELIISNNKYFFVCDDCMKKKPEEIEESLNFKMCELISIQKK